MLKKERHDFVMRQINLHNRVLTSDLVRLLNVSEDTVRRDLLELSNDNLLYRVHGGALSKAYHSFSNESTVYAREAKIDIAKKTIPLISEGMIVLTSGGTTIIELVKQLSETLQATFFTISPLVAMELAKCHKSKVILIGGMFSRLSQITYGGRVVRQLSEINADICLLETSTIHPTSGLTDNDWEIYQVKKAMLSSSRNRQYFVYPRNLIFV